MKETDVRAPNARPNSLAVILIGGAEGVGEGNVK